jgi:hypothetical protein
LQAAAAPAAVGIRRGGRKVRAGCAAARRNQLDLFDDMPPAAARLPPIPSSRMNEQPLLAHLLELRTRLVRAILGLMLVFLACFTGLAISIMCWPSPCWMRCPMAAA